jgi:hypothetical protein
MDDLLDDPRRMRLFLEYWALGGRDRRVREKISAALQRYRTTFRSLTEGVLPTKSSQSAAGGVTADAVAAVAVSLVSGLAVQAMIDPDQFDVAAYKRTVDEIVQRLVPSPATTADPATARRPVTRRQRAR